MFDKLMAVPAPFFTKDAKRLTGMGYLFLILLCFGFFTPGLVTMPPTDRDESSFAQASKQMIESGNYTDIRLQAEPRYKKPIGIYWLQTTAVRLLNPQHLDEIWAYRLPSFLGATIAVLMTAALGALLFGPTVGLLAAMMLAGCALLNVEARLAKTDAMLLACIMVAQYGLARAYINKAAGWGLFLWFWTAMAAGVLIKGPIILLPLLSTLLWLRFSDKNITWFHSLRPLLGLIYMLALIAPWFIAISMQSHGAFMQQSAGQDMLAKIWQGQNRGIMPPGMHLLALPIAFFPFALFIVFAAPDVWKNRQDVAIKFCLGWIVPTWIVFELSFTKLPHYVLPAYPALALLAAKFMSDGFPTVAATARRLPIVLIVALWIMIGAGFAAAFILLPVFVDQTWYWPQIAAGAVMFLAQGASLLLVPKDKMASLVILTLGSLLFMTATFGNTLPRLQHLWMSREIIEGARQAALCPHVQIIAIGYHEPSLIFLAGTDTLFPSNGTEAAHQLQENICRIAVIDPTHKSEFLDAFKASDVQPEDSGSIDGLNSGHGGEAKLTLYRLHYKNKL